MSDLLLGGILGVLAMCAVAMAATKLGLISVGLGREREQVQEQAPAAAKRSYPRLGCTITVEAKNELTGGLKPQVRLFATIENEGEMVIRSLKGFWKVVTADKHKHAPIRIQRDVLAPNDKYLESYLLDEGIDTQGEGIRFDVEIEFDYMAQADYESRHYSAKYRYDRKYHRMVKL